MSKMNTKKPKIIICTTFRDFKGSENDDIQRLFLRSLESQTYRNFEVVVTLFGEENVRKELNHYNFKTVCYDGDAQDFRYCLTQVVLNAMNHADYIRNENFIVLWTTADVVYNKDFLETIVRRVESNVIGTSHPHKIYTSIDNYKKGKDPSSNSLFSGFDLLFFDRTFISKKSTRNSLEKYIFYDWGIFEHFLIALNELTKDVKMVNIFQETQINKIENDREITKEPSKFLLKSHRRNSRVLKGFLEDNNISKSYFDLTYCHLRFRLTTQRLQHYWLFRADLLKYFLRSIYRIIKSIIPRRVKKYFSK